MIVLMVLDHVRDYFHFHALGFDPTDPAASTPAVFATRWVTHLCAPTFVFLAGVAIALQRQRAAELRVVSGFLARRGAWLAFLDLTIISFGFNFGPFLFLQVMFAIGLSMVAMAGLIRLPPRVVGSIGGVLVFGGPWMSSILGALWGNEQLLQTVLFVPGPLPGVPGILLYPVVPWLGLMCLGYASSGLFEERLGVARLRGAGLALLAGFLVLRGIDSYGEPHAWTPYPALPQTLMSFLNVSKYPPSTDYVLVTLGLSFLLGSTIDRVRGPLRNVLLTFGQTPLFTYVTHVYVAHLLMVLIGAALGFPVGLFLNFIQWNAAAVFGRVTPPIVSADWGFALGGVYLAWIAVLVMVYPMSRWFSRLKQTKTWWWLRYL